MELPGAVVAQAYFAGKLQSFDLKLRPEGTEFQLRVLEELQKIPYGSTTSYGDIAERIGKPKAKRHKPATAATSPHARQAPWE